MAKRRRNPEILRTMGARLLTERRRSGLTQAEVQEAIGAGKEVYPKWERGERPPPADAIHRLSRLYGVSAEYLVGRSPDRSGLHPGHYLVDMDALDIIKCSPQPAAAESLGAAKEHPLFWRVPARTGVLDAHSFDELWAQLTATLRTDADAD